MLSTIRTTKDRANPLQPPVRDAMLAAVPGLRAFAISLCGKVDRADDLVQETLLRAIGNINSFQPGTNMCAWLFTILRNLFRSEYRKQRREVQDTDGSYLDSLKTPPEQHSRVEFEDFRDALAKLPSSSARPCFWSARRASHTRRRLRSVRPRQERSRAESIVHAGGSRSCSPSTTPTGSVRTTRRAPF